MPSPSSPHFCPPWLKATVCVLLVVVFSGLIVARFFGRGAADASMVIVPSVFMDWFAATCIVTGRPPKQAFSIMADLFKGRAAAHLKPPDEKLPRAKSGGRQHRDAA